MTGPDRMPTSESVLPMFPLGSVLFPAMPLALRVFEERYLAMMERVLRDDISEFGVVLIERGQEVGGGEQRFGIGTVARITQLESGEQFLGLLAEGGRRFEVVQWIPDDPYPQALVRELPELEWRDDLAPLRAVAERTVRRALAVASEFADQQWSSVVEVSDDPIAGAWQLAAIAPLNELDQVALLGSDSAQALLDRLIVLSAAAEHDIRSGWTDPLDDDDDDDDDDGFGADDDAEGDDDR